MSLLASVPASPLATMPSRAQLRKAMRAELDKLRQALATNTQEVLDKIVDDCGDDTQLSRILTSLINIAQHGEGVEREVKAKKPRVNVNVVLRERERVAAVVDTMRAVGAAWVGKDTLNQTLESFELGCDLSPPETLDLEALATQANAISKTQISHHLHENIRTYSLGLIIFKAKNLLPTQAEFREWLKQVYHMGPKRADQLINYTRVVKCYPTLLGVGYHAIAQGAVRTTEVLRLLKPIVAAIKKENAQTRADQLAVPSPDFAFHVEVNNAGVKTKGEAFRFESIEPIADTSLFGHGTSRSKEGHFLGMTLGPVLASHKDVAAGYTVADKHTKLPTKDLTDDQRIAAFEYGFFPGSVPEEFEQHMSSELPDELEVEEKKEEGDGMDAGTTEAEVQAQAVAAAADQAAQDTSRRSTRLTQTPADTTWEEQGTMSVKTFLWADKPLYSVTLEINGSTTYNQLFEMWRDHWHESIVHSMPEDQRMGKMEYFDNVVRRNLEDFDKFHAYEVLVRGDHNKLNEGQPHNLGELKDFGHYKCINRVHPDNNAVLGEPVANRMYPGNQIFFTFSVHAGGKTSTDWYLDNIPWWEDEEDDLLKRYGIRVIVACCVRCVFCSATICSSRR